MTPTEWFAKRAEMAKAWGLPEEDVLPETVWYLAWPQPNPTERMKRRAEELAKLVRCGLPEPRVVSEVSVWLRCVFDPGHGGLCSWALMSRATPDEPSECG